MSLGALHIIKQSNKINSASVIFLHGSGDTGRGLLDWVKFLVGEFSMPHINFYFPTAPLRPYTPLQGDLSNVWFDRYDVTPNVPEHKETLESIGSKIKMFINDIVESGTPLDRIVIGWYLLLKNIFHCGFSMGGALALHMAYQFSPGLAGVFTLSSFLNKNSTILNAPKSMETPLHMFHGDRDTLVPISWGQQTHKELAALGINAKFVAIKNTMHELKEEELKELFQWIEKILPPLDSDK